MTRPPLADVLLALCGLGVTGLIALTWSDHGTTWFWLANLLLHAGLTAMLLIRRTHVRVSFIGTYAMLAALAAVIAVAPVNVGVSPMILAAPLSLYLVARHLPVRWGATALLLGVAGAFVSPMNRLPAGARALIPLMIIAMIATYLIATAQRRTALQHEAEIAAERTLLEREAAVREARARSDERTRIAREIHDVVGHSLTVTGVQARTALAIGGEEQLRGGLEAVAASSADALAQLRSLVSLLRDDSAAPLAVQGSLASLPGILADVRRSGLDLDAQIPDDAALADLDQRWPAPVRLAVLRVVQEALTNMLRHRADGSAGTLRIEEGADTCRILAQNRAPMDPDATASTVRSNGSGLAGLRERVELLGGEVRVGRRNSERGTMFELDAVIPLLPRTPEEAR